MFKKMTGGDAFPVIAKYKGKICCRFPGKLTFYQNDSPEWSAGTDYAIRRRVWVLPMRAQHLRKDDIGQRKKLAAEGKSHHICDHDGKYDISKVSIASLNQRYCSAAISYVLRQDLEENFIPAYLKWVIDGAVK